MTTELHHGDCLDVMRTMPEASVDAVVCDPPYGLAFMGKHWDHGLPGVAFWAEALRVAKPGAPLLAFGGTRTFHRLTCAIEDAGWEIRDCLSWLYGTGFPKSLAIDKAIDRQRDDRKDIERVVVWLEAKRFEAGVSRRRVEEHFGTKNIGQAFFTITPGSSPRVPAWDQWLSLKSLFGFGNEMDAEVWRLNGRKGQPGEDWARREKVGESAQASGIANATAGHHTVGGTVAQHYDITAPASDLARRFHGYGTALKPAWEPIVLAMKPTDGTFADNARKHGVAGLNVDGCRIATDWETDPTRRGWQGGKMTKFAPVPGDVGTDWKDEKAHPNNAGRWPANLALDEEAARALDEMSGSVGAAAPVRGTEPSEACAGQVTGRRARVPGAFHGDSGGASRFFYCAKASRKDRTVGGEKINTHPTVKPNALMRWLVRMVSMPGGSTILDPFMGSGSTGVACRDEGQSFVGIEREREYFDIARQRIAGELDSDEPEDPESEFDLPGQMKLFEDAAA